MTENNAAPSGQEQNLIESAIAEGHRVGWFLACPPSDAMLTAFARLLLSKLRAEGVQAGDERAAFVAWLTGAYPDAYSEPEAMRLWHHEHVAALAWEERARRAALASAPVAGEAQRPVGRVRHFNYSGIARNGFSQEAVLNDDVPSLPDGTLLYAAPQASEADGQWRDLALKFDAQRMVFRELLKAAVPLLIGPEDFKAQIEKALASSPGECLKASEAVRDARADGFIAGFICAGGDAEEAKKQAPQLQACIDAGNAQADKDGGVCAKGAGDAEDAARYRLAASDCILILRGDAALGRAEWDRKLDRLATQKGAK